MSEHDPHERAADAAEQELEELQEHADRLGEDIDRTRTDWERKQADPTVPGAVGDPQEPEGPATLEEAKAQDDFDPEAATRDDVAGDDD